MTFQSLITILSLLSIGLTQRSSPLKAVVVFREESVNGIINFEQSVSIFFSNKYHNTLNLKHKL
jgi:hypothetical protein